MSKSLGILLTGLLVSASCLAQGSLVGTYKLVSIKAEIDGKLRDDRTKPPHGYLIITRNITTSSTRCKTASSAPRTRTRRRCGNR